MELLNSVIPFTHLYFDDFLLEYLFTVVDVSNDNGDGRTKESGLKCLVDELVWFERKFILFLSLKTPLNLYNIS